MKTNKLISILLAALMLPTFTGCVKTPVEESGTRETETEAQTEETQTEETAAPTETETETVSESESESESETEGEARAYEIDPAHGTAVTMQGKTLLILIFASDSETAWDFSRDEDRETMENALHGLDVATAYLTEQAARYGKALSFVYDGGFAGDLIYRADFEETLVRFDGGGYKTQARWLEAHIDLPSLMDRYGADNASFLFYFNTDYTNEVNPWTLSRRNGEQVQWEISNFYLRFDGFDMTAPGMAHELMHHYGARDLYYADEGIPQAYVDYLDEIDSKDIMHSVAASNDRVPNEFTDLDAYYVGIAPRPAVADEWGLAYSEHDAP